MRKEGIENLLTKNGYSPENKFQETGLTCCLKDPGGETGSWL
jgi:hypothetical protein